MWMWVVWWWERGGWVVECVGVGVGVCCVCVVCCVVCVCVWCVGVCVGV